MEPTRKKVLVGTHRECLVEETLARLEPLLERFEITRIANVTGLDDIGIPTVVVTRPNARALSVSQGKGITLAAAKVSGIMESIEQWHAERIGSPVRLGSYRERRALGNVVDPARLPGYARAWDPDARILWIDAAPFGGGPSIEVPFELVHLDFTLPLPPGSGFFPIGSNGLASGNSIEEAILHGACELVERDAIALFYRLPPERQATRRIRLETIDDANCTALLDRLFAARVGVAIWDLTSDVGVATFLCSIVEREFEPFRRVGLARGFGCHVDSGVALSRALCEAAQSRLTRIAGSRDDFQEDEVDFIRDRESILVHQQQVQEQGFASFRDVPSQSFWFLEEDLAWVVQRLNGVGLDQLLYVDISTPALGISVVRVVVPGLEGSADVPGYVPGTRARAIHNGSEP